MIPFQRGELSPDGGRTAEAYRISAFDKMNAEAARGGITEITVMRRNVGRNLAMRAEELQKLWADRNYWLQNNHHPNALIAHKNDHALKRSQAAEAINDIRWGVWILNRLEQPDVVAEIAAGPGYEMLHWGKPTYLRGLDEMVHKMPTILDNKGRVVAMVTREPQQGRGPTMKAWIFARPGATTEPPLNWALLRSRKAAVKWMVGELHKRAIALFGNEIDLPEWTP